MTEQDRQNDAARLEISDETRYARAGARVDRDPARGEPARARVAAGQGAAPAPAAPAGRPGATPAPGPGQPRNSSGRFATYPLRERAARIRTLGHAAYSAAAGEPREEIAAGADYARSAAATADRWGVHDPASASAVAAAIAALMAAGDALTAAMHDWRPAS